MATNTFQHVSDWMAMKTLSLLVNKLEVSAFFNTDYDEEFKREFAVGDTVQVKMPQEYTIREGLTYSAQNINRRTTSITMQAPFGIDFEWDSVEKALRMERSREEIAKQYLEPAANQLKQEIDSRAALFAYQNANNFVGVLGTDPSSFQSFSSAAMQRMVELSCPPGGDKGMFIAPQVNTALKAAAISYHNPASDISRQYREGSIGRADGFDWYQSMSLYSHTAGTWQSAVTMAGAGQTGASILVNCTSGDTFKKGDKISIATVYPVNPRTRRTSNVSATKQFTVLEDVTASTTTATLPISPAIYGPGSQYQNVDALNTDTATVTLFSGTASPNGKSGKVGLALHRNAFALVSTELEKPNSAELASRATDPNSKVSIRFVRAWDQYNSRMTNRWDVQIGFGRLYSDSCAVALLGA